MNEADYDVESRAIDYKALLEALEDIPGDTLFYGSWTDAEKAETNTAFREI